MESCTGGIEELRALGSASVKKILINHGAQEPFFGVKVSDLKPLEKRLKPNYDLALELYATGVSDAMYLAGLITDDLKMTQDDLRRWVQGANWSLHSESTVPWVASGGRHGRDLAVEWIDSPVETIACAGWCTLSSLSGIRPDSEFDIPEYEALLRRVSSSIHDQPNRVRYCMNGFVIASGCNITALTKVAADAASNIGVVKVMMGNTACKVRYAPETIAEAVAKGAVGKKRKTAKC